MFDLSSPAENISELLDKLESEHKPAHIYRGQNLYWEPCVPSSMRPFLKDGAFDPSGWRKLHSVSEKPNLGREFEFDVLQIKSLLGKSLGRAIANILAQQYGLSSDMLDVSASFAIAAFFATCQWPTYEPFIPKNKETDLGVVFRMECGAPPSSYEAFTAPMENVYVMLSSGQKVFFENVHTLSSDAEKSLGSAGLADFFSREFDGAFQANEFFKMAFYCHPAIMREYTIEALARAGMDRLVGEDQLFSNLEDLYDSSRIARQAAGLVSPPLMYPGATYKELFAQPWNGDQNWLKADPDKAIKSGICAVHDLNRNDKFEKFYFKHDERFAVHVPDMEALWPSRENDALLNLMYGVVQKYFREVRGIDDFDPFMLLDRGFQDPE